MKTGWYLFLKRYRSIQNGRKVLKTVRKIVFAAEEEILKRSLDYLRRDEAEILKTVMIWEARTCQRLQREGENNLISARKARTGEFPTPTLAGSSNLQKV